MAVLDAGALTADPDGMAYLVDMLGTADEAARPGRRFPVEAWMPAIPAAQAPDRQEWADQALATAG